MYIFAGTRRTATARRFFSATRRWSSSHDWKACDPVRCVHFPSALPKVNTQQKSSLSQKSSLTYTLGCRIT